MKAIGKALARERAAWLTERARADLARLKLAIAEARQRRKLALHGSRQLCRRARAEARARAKTWRANELARIKREAAEMRTAARNRCQARRYRIERSGARVVEQRRATLLEERRLQAQLARAGQHAIRQRARVSRVELAQEDDDAVRNNLPPELLVVWERVRKHIKGGKRTTRTEAFLEWAESHPDEVLEYQQHDTDAEVRRLVAEHEAAQRQLRKTRPTARRRASGSGDVDVPF